MLLDQQLAEICKGTILISVVGPMDPDERPIEL
jgi:hypothetical protein